MDGRVKPRQDGRGSWPGQARPGQQRVAPKTIKGVYRLKDGASRHFREGPDAKAAIPSGARNLCSAALFRAILDRPTARCRDEAQKPCGRRAHERISKPTGGRGSRGLVCRLRSVFDRRPSARGGDRPAKGGVCPNMGAAFADPMSKPHWNGWGVDPSQHRFQPADMARLAPSDAPRLKLKWAFGFPGANRSVAQPTIFGGRVFVGSQNGKVYSLDAKSGCIYWAVRSRQARAVGRRHRSARRRLGGVFRRCRRQCSRDRRADRQGCCGRPNSIEHPAAIITGSPTLVGTTLFVPVSSYEEAKASGPVLRLLHLPRQRRRAGRRIGKDAVEDIHDRAGSQAGRRSTRRAFN